MKELVDRLKSLGVLRTPRIIEAFLANDRKKFIPKEYQNEAYFDVPLAIGSGQTISQPYTVAFMMELLSPALGQKILDIGFGSGWTAAILAHVVGAKGKVYGLEIVKEIFELGEKNLRKFNYQNIELINKSGWEGFPAAAPFDRILVSAAAEDISEKLKNQLAIGGIMIIPVGSAFSCALTRLEKKSESKFETESYPGFAFVPFIK